MIVDESRILCEKLGAEGGVNSLLVADLEPSRQYVNTGGRETAIRNEVYNGPERLAEE